MMRLVVKATLAAAAILVAGGAVAAEIDGKWVGTLNQAVFTFEFKADGEKLTGTLNNAAAPGALEIKDGRIKGDEISFHIMRNLNNVDTKIEWTGKLTGDELKLQRSAAAGVAAADLVAKRVTQ